MSIAVKIERSRQIIRDALQGHRRPVALWSAGKDSQVLLYLLRHERISIPVVYFRGFADARKHEFADWVINAWKLNLHEWQPNERDVIAQDGHVNLIEAYQVGDLRLAFPLESERGYVPNAQSLCAIEKLNEPVASEPQQYNVIFIGQRGDDKDGVLGNAHLDADSHQIGDVSLVYPLRDWTEADIWAASALLDIPQNEDRYLHGKMSANADYWNLCTRCLQPGQAGEMVQCPRGGEVYNLGKYLDLEARRLAWRRQFINTVSPGEVKTD